MLPTRDRLPCLRETTQSFRPDIDSDRRCLKFVLLPSPARRRGAIIFPFAFTQIPAPVERFGVNARAAVRGRPSRSTPCSTAAPRNHETGSTTKCPFVVCQSYLRYIVWVELDVMLTADLPD